MEEKPTAILQAEEVKEAPVAQEAAAPAPEPAAAVPASETWSKFPPQVEDASQDQESKAPKGLIIVVVILVLLAVGVVGFVVYKSNAMSKQQIAAVPTPTPGETESITPTDTPMATITDKSVVKIQVLNGSGIVGQAGQIATALEKDDFKTPDTGNFDGDKTKNTLVNYTTKVDKSLVDEVVTVLKKSFTSVDATVSSTLTDFDIQVITGTGK